MELILHYILVFLLCMSVCEILREAFMFTRCFMKTEQYSLSSGRMVLLWSAVSYIITYIICA